MAIAFVKNVGSTTGSMSTTFTVTVPAAGVALGNLLVVRGIFASDSGSVSVADTQGNTYTARQTGGAVGGDTQETYVFTCVVGTALVSGNTITLTSTKTTGNLVIDEWSGIDVFDAISAVATGTSASPSQAITPAVAGLVIGFVFAGSADAAIGTEDGDSTGGDTWHTLTPTNQGSNKANFAAYKIATSATTQTYNPSLTTSDDWGDSVLAWKAPATGHTATGALTLPAVTISGTGSEVFTSTGAVAVPPITIAGSGHHPHQATGALTLPTVTISGTAEEVFTSTGAVTTQPVVIAGDGIHTNEKIGTGALTLPAVTLAGTGEETFTATGAVALSAVTISGVGAEAFTATGTPTLVAPTLDGTGAVVLTGTGAISLAGISIAGVGDSDTEPEPEPLPTAGGRRRKPTPKRHIEGYGALVVAPSLVAGRGVTFDDDIRWLLPPELVLAGAI